MKRMLAFGVLGIALVRELFRRGPAMPPAAADEQSRASQAIRFVVAHPWLTIAGVGAAGLLAGAVVMMSGVVPISAREGHWKITEILLHFAMRRSIATHAVTVGEPPDLNDPSLVLRGAGHFEGGCRPCHGGPLGDVPTIPRAMTPAAPALPHRIPEWTPEELFYIVKHGVKFTGMPAWPARDRDDEVWAVVAFLRRLPTMTLEEYHALVRSDRAWMAELPTGSSGVVEPPEVVRQVCARCHGVDGLGRGTGAFPKLAGQHAAYMVLSLDAYASGERHSGVMRPIAEALSAEVRREVAAYYAALPGLEDQLDIPVLAGPTSGPDALYGISAGPTFRWGAPGADLVFTGAPPRIPSCQDCHGPTPIPKNPAYPKLLGQYPEYLVLQLELLRSDDRGGSPYVRLMHAFADRLTDDQIAAAAKFYGRADAVVR